LVSHYNFITDCIIEENKNGIRLDQSTGNELFDLAIFDNLNGILCEHSHENVIRKNTIYRNDNCGISIGTSSLSNDIKQNTIRNNNIGISLVETSFGNEIFHNNFFENSKHAYSMSNNLFDNGQEGNYWDDWDGTGIYEIDGGAIDNYPLSYPYGGNNAPLNPSIDGTDLGRVGDEYTYYATSTDPDGDQIRYGFDWDLDAAVDDWTELLDSGVAGEMSHSWNKEGTHKFRVIAEDSEGEESGWVTYQVEMPRKKSFLLMRLVELLSERFPILIDLLH
jgi:parallel beta-helix repeat protein